MIFNIGADGPFSGASSNSSPAFISRITSPACLVGLAFISVLSWCAKQSSVVLVNCEVFIMVRDRKPCRKLCGGREQSCPSKPEWPKARAAVSRKLVSASLGIIESGQPFRRGEASIGPEAAIICRGRTLRGERRQRAPKEPPGTWEARHRAPAARQEQPPKGSHNLRSGGVVASERPIVAMKSRLQSEWSQGALATVTLSQMPLELIG